MLSCLFVAFVTSALPPDASAPAPGFGVGLHLESTRFVATNFTSAPRWLCFSNGLERELRVLTPGGTLEYQFPDFCMWGIDLELLRLQDRRVLSSGSFALDQLAEIGAPTFWMETGSGCWYESANGLRPVDAPANHDGEPETSNAPGAGPLHVPVIHPSDQPNDGRPPKIEERPLPPV